MATLKIIMCPGYEIKLKFDGEAPVLEVEECGVPLYYDYFQVNSDPEWSYLLGSHLLVK